jgi:hypothetical protein
MSADRLEVGDYSSCFVYEEESLERVESYFSICSIAWKIVAVIVFFWLLKQS